MIENSPRTDFSIRQRAAQLPEPVAVQTEPWILALHNVTDRKGIWRPAQIDVSEDIVAWPKLIEPQRRVVIRALARFVHGENQVDVNLAPLVSRRLMEGRDDEARYITRFQEEEKKHTAFFRRFFEEVIQQESPGVGDKYSKSFRHMFDVVLVRELAALRRAGWKSEIRALTTYMIVAEGILAETGYYGFAKALTTSSGVALLPGLLNGFEEIKRDEARHIAYGVNAIRRIVDQVGVPAKFELGLQLTKLIPTIFGCVGMVHKEFDPFPFESLKREDLRAFALQKLKERLGACFNPRKSNAASIIPDE